MSDRLADIELFLRVIQEGSISAAARSLDLSAAVASQRLNRLERDLGVRLLHRTTRRLHPTTEGERLAERGLALIEELVALTDGLRSAAHDVSGTLRVTAPATFGRLHVSPLLPAFLAEHPNLRISLDLSDQRVDLVAGAYDLAIRFGGLEDSSLVARKLAANQRILCASPDYLRRRGHPATPADLAAHDCVLLVEAQGRQNTWKLRDRDGNESVVRVRGRVESNFNEVVRDATIAGLGIAQHSMWHIGDDLRAGRLERVLPDHEAPGSGIYAVKLQRRQVPQRVRVFEDFLADRWVESLRL